VCTTHPQFTTADESLTNSRTTRTRTYSRHAVRAARTMATDHVGAAAAKPVLRGVVFDMDGTLTELNLDFAEMKRRIGVRVCVCVCVYMRAHARAWTLSCS
jgi:hypothetical protein